MSELREERILDVTDNSLTSRFKAALASRPDWAQSLTATMVDSRVRVTYSSSNNFGVDLQAVWNYLDRH